MEGHLDIKVERKTRIACLYFRKEVSIHAIAESCYRFTPELSVREFDGQGSAIFLEITRSLTLFSEQGLILRLRSLCRRFKCVPDITIAHDAASALTLARYRCRRLEDLPLEALLDYASPFSRNAELESKIDRLIESMSLLGLKKLKDFSSLSPASLASRFGEEGVDLSRSVREGFLVPWPRFVPPERMIEDLDLESSGVLGLYGEGCENLEPLFFVLKGMVDRLSARLRGRGLRAVTISLNFNLEKYIEPKDRRRHWVIQFPLAQGSTQGILPILRERIQFDLQQNPLAGPVTALSLQILETALGRVAQKDLFDSSEDEFEAWAALISRLENKLGEKSVFTAEEVQSHCPEKSWKKKTGQCPTWRDYIDLEMIESDIHRPTRVLPSPQPLYREGDYLLPFSRHEKDKVSAWKILDWQGPERIANEWWDEFLPHQESHEEMNPEFQRDYFKVLTESGEQLWVFTLKQGFSGLLSGLQNQDVASSSEVYLHGYFD